MDWNGLWPGFPANGALPKILWKTLESACSAIAVIQVQKAGKIWYKWVAGGMLVPGLKLPRLLDL